jgi:phospholipid/cholesterol/gamma-HCH transport system ATP-binding protein
MRAATDPTPAIRLSGVCTRFGDKQVHQGLDLEVHRGEILALVGGSGSGKSTLLREMIALQRADAGTLEVLGVDVGQANAEALLALRQAACLPHSRCWKT